MVPIAMGLSDGFEHLFGPALHLDAPPWLVISLFTLMLFLVDDQRVLLHLLLIKFLFCGISQGAPLSESAKTPFTIYRSHPVESYLYACRMALTQGIVVGCGYYVFGDTLSMYDILGANAFVFLFNIFGANLRHSYIY